MSSSSRAGTLRHCPCNLIPEIMRFGDLWDVAALVAPRLMLTVSGREDALNPVEEVDHAVSELGERYAAPGFPDRHAHRYGPGGRRFFADIMWPWIEERV